MADTRDTARGGGRFAAESPWVRRCARADPALRLVCFPYAGGGASLFHPLPALLPDTVEVLAIQPPGREDRSREPFPADIGVLARACAIALRPYRALPLAFYGHCAGALLAYEVAHHMGERFGTWPRHLVAAAQPAPHLPGPEAPLHRLPDEELREAVQGRGGLPEALVDAPGLIEFLLPLLRADFALWEGYRHRSRPRLPCPVTTLRGDADHVVDAEAVAPWREHTSAGSADVVVDGGHYFINDVSEDTARTLARVLRTG
ncbi:thioesterase II family protein [Haloactinospora alba]|nr:alpha/beta fold hydrolase [Haloactinospora alba]